MREGGQLRHRGPHTTLILGLLAFGCNGFVGEWAILDGVGARFAKVERGHTKEQVIAALGPPARESGVFVLPQRKGHEALFEEARESQAARFLYWDIAVDDVAVVGLNGQGRVVFKCRAGP